GTFAAKPVVLRLHRTHPPPRPARTPLSRSVAVQPVVFRSQALYLPRPAPRLSAVRGGGERDGAAPSTDRSGSGQTADGYTAARDAARRSLMGRRDGVGGGS
ncbi:MAG TPA: hypothetical protein VKV33_01110, partial [Streptosporangiaceae bacterium]|nr:hypothetical protein [Streptosporangiaceae bacterium]